MLVICNLKFILIISIFFNRLLKYNVKGKWNKDFIEDEGVVFLSEGGCAYGNFHRNKLSGYGCVQDSSGNLIVGHF